MSAPATARRGLRIPIRFKILLSLLVVITVVVSVITFTMANLFHSDKRTYIRDLTSLVAVHAAEEVNSIVQGYNERLQVFGRVMYDPFLPQTEKAKLLEGLFEDFPEFIAVTLYQNGAEQATVFDARALQNAGLNKQDLQTFRDANPLPFENISPERPFVLNATLDDRLPAFTLATPVALVDTEAPVIAAATIQLEALLRVAERTSVFDIFIVDNVGDILVSRETQRVSARAPVDWLPLDTLRALEPLIKGQTAASSLEYLAEDNEMVGAFARVEVSKMVLGAQIPKSAAYLTARELLNNLTGVSLVLLIISALMSLFWSRQITRPVEQLSLAAREVGQGKFDIHVEITSNDEMGELAHSFNHMTTELHNREEALKHAQAALVQSEKMSAFGQLSAGIAHEVKNPLAGILGYAQLSMRKVDKESPVYRHLSLIEKETKRCKDIIENLMKFARQEKVAMEPTDLNQVVSEACTIVDHQLTINQVRLNKELAPELPKFMGNGNQVQQVLMNLMINAQQAMDGKDGSVTLSTRLLENNTLEVRVSDTGPGIPKEIQAKIFEPFFTTKPVGKGTGLGLSVSYGIIRDHQGEIRIESEPGQGASFVITLPAIAAMPTNV